MKENFRRFVAGLGEAQKLLHIVECVQPGQMAELDGLRNHSVVQSASILWHKERLLNIALQALPPECDAVMWLDGDILFENQTWLRDTQKTLDDFDVIQPFEQVCQWPLSSSDPTVVSFASQIKRDPDLNDRPFQEHGHTGYAWAVRRDVLGDVGLFDESIVGSGDHVMAHAFCEDRDVPCLDAPLGTNTPLALSYRHWRGKIAPEPGTRRSLGFVPGRIRHLRHGSRERRQYMLRSRRINELGFDPARDLMRNGDDCWEWRDPMGETARFVETYFRNRQDDKSWIGMRF